MYNNKDSVFFKIVTDFIISRREKLFANKEEENDMKISIKNCLLDLFLNPHDVDNEDVWRFLGFTFLRIGAGMGILLFFGGPIPFSGHLEVEISTLLFFVGGLLLVLKRKKNFPLMIKTS